MLLHFIELLFVVFSQVFAKRSFASMSKFAFCVRCNFTNLICSFFVCTFRLNGFCTMLYRLSCLIFRRLMSETKFLLACFRGECESFLNNFKSIYLLSIYYMSIYYIFKCGLHYLVVFKTLQPIFFFIFNESFCTFELYRILLWLIFFRFSILNSVFISPSLK